MYMTPRLIVGFDETPHTVMIGILGTHFQELAGRRHVTRTCRDTQNYEGGRGQ